MFIKLDHIHVKGKSLTRAFERYIDRRTTLHALYAKLICKNILLVRRDLQVCVVIVLQGWQP
jgi:hypothetical protein